MGKRQATGVAYIWEIDPVIMEPLSNSFLSIDKQSHDGISMTMATTRLLIDWDQDEMVAIFLYENCYILI